MLQDIKNQEYHFIITHKDLSSSFFIAPNHDIYTRSIEVLKKRQDVSYFFVIKGEHIFNSNSDSHIQNQIKLITDDTEDI